MRQEIIFKDDYFEIRYFGDVEISGFFQTTSSLLKHPSFEKNSKYLADYSELKGIDESSLSYTDLKSYAALQQKVADRAGRITLARIGLPNAEAKALANLWVSLCKHYGVDIEAEDFTSKEKAVEWLRSR
jgi:hypothetical protein